MYYNLLQNCQKPFTVEMYRDMCPVVQTQQQQQQQQRWQLLLLYRLKLDWSKNLRRFCPTGYVKT